MTDNLVRYRDLDPFVAWEDPDAFVEVNGHPLYRYDAEKAMRMIAECYRLGGFEFRASPDLANMQVSHGEKSSAVEHGFHLVVDDSLAENTVVKA